MYPVKLEFSNDYPSRPPKVSLPAGFFHPNVFPSGKICLSILNEDKAWKPSITVKQILVGVQDLLDNPNNSDPAQDQARFRPASSPALCIHFTSAHLSFFCLTVAADFALGSAI